MVDTFKEKNTPACILIPFRILLYYSTISTISLLFQSLFMAIQIARVQWAAVSRQYSLIIKVNKVFKLFSTTATTRSPSLTIFIKQIGNARVIHTVQLINTNCYQVLTVTCEKCKRQTI